MHALPAETRAFGGFPCVGYPSLRSRRPAASVLKRLLATIGPRVVQTISVYGRSEFKRRTHSQAGPLPPFEHAKRFRFTQVPCPGWTFGDGMKSSVEQGEEKELWAAKEGARRTKVWDMDSTSSKETYQLLTSAIVPRPIAFVSSLSSGGVPNLAPFSYFSMISHNPPLLSISFALSQRRPKDTRENILQTKEFTVNLISEPFIDAANSTSVESPADMNEWLLSGLTPAESVLVKPAIVQESAVSMECKLHSYQDIAPSPSVLPTTTVVLGLIRRVHVRESFLREDGLTLDPSKLRPVARLGSVTYARVVEGFDLPRVSWKATKGVYEEIERRERAAGGS